MKARFGLFSCLAASLVLVGLGALIIGCGSSAPLHDRPSGSLGYVPGVPNFDLRVAVVPGGNQTAAVVTVGVPPASLVFAPRGGVYAATYERIVRVLDGNGALLSERAFSDEVEVEEYERTLTFRPYLHRDSLQLAPGRYQIQVVLLDGSSGQQTLRSTSVHVPGPTEQFLGSPTLDFAGSDKERLPALTPFVPESAEALRVVVPFQMPGARDEIFQLSFLQVERDTTIPNPPYWVMPGHATLAYRGFSLTRMDTVFVDARTASEASGEIVFDLPRVPRGLYRLDVRSQSNGPRNEPLRASTYFVVTTTAFPRIETLDQMVETLAYVAYEREIGRIVEAPNPVERKQRFDAFWGSLVGRRSVAVNLLETYYARIEEANLLYSSFKEGWKTDRGMVYVLLGAPVLVDSYAESEVWRYSYGDDALYTFVFDRVRIPEADGVYENYILRRRPYYEHVWLQVLDRWRSGVVL